MAAGDGGSLSFSLGGFLGSYPDWRIGQIGAVYESTNSFDGALVFKTSTSQNGGTEKMRISSGGLVKFNSYGAGTLVTDSSGNITVSSGGGAGGPYLPLSAGLSYSLTDSLYINNVDQNNTNRYGNLSSEVGFTRSPVTGDPNQWFKVVELGGSPKRIKFSIIAEGDNTNSYDNFLISTSGYGMNMHIQKLPGGRYNTSKLLSVAVINPSNSGSVEIWIKLLPVYSGTGATHVACTSDVLASATILASATTTAPTITVNDTQLDISSDNRFYATLQASRGATFGAKVGIGTNAPAAMLTVAGDSTISGNVGIGTTSPGYKLSVDDNTVTTVPKTLLQFDAGSIADNGGYNIDFRVSSNNTADRFVSRIRGIRESTGALSQLSFWTESGNALEQRMTIRASGNVGIGTDDPISKLQVGTVLSSNKLTIGGYYGQGGGHLAYRSGHGSNSSVWDTAIISATDDGNYNGKIEFKTTNSGGNTGAVPNTKMIIKANGNVGIGTTLPGSKLEVNVIDDGFDDIDVLQLKRTWATGSGSDRAHGILFSDPNSRMATIYADRTNSGSNYNSDLLFATNTGTSGTSLSTKMVIKAGGDVGIGTDAPATLLHVKGGADDNESLLYVENTHSTGGTQYPSAMFTNTNGDHSFGTIAEFRTGNVSGNDRPSILFTNGATTNNWSVGQGVYSANDNFAIGFRTAHPGVVSAWADPKLVINTSGNVGIGTTSPATKFVVSDAGGTGLEITPEDANTRISLVAYDRLDFAYRELNFDGYNYSFRTSGNVKAVMLNTGNVGIGTTSPSQKLHLQNGILLVNSNTPVSTGIWMPDTNGNPSLRIVTDQSSVANSSIVNAWGNSSNAGVMVGSTRNDGFAFQVRSGVTLTDGFANDTGNSRMVVLGNGNVGIGTTSPSAKLSVIGDINFGGGNNNGIIEVSGSGDLIFKYKGSDPALTLDGGAVKTIVHNRLDALNIVNINNPSNNESILNIRDDDSSSNGHIAFENSSEVTGIVSSGTDFINFRAGDGVAITDSPMLTLFPNRIGINTTSPNSNVALDIDGRVLIKDSTGVADFYLGNYATANHFRFHTNNANTYFDMNCGNIYWRDGASTRYTFFPSTANMTVNGTITQNSDARVKENVVEIGDCISKVQAMKGVYYNRTDFNTETKKVGVIAQDVEAVLPELIIESPEDGLKSVAYSELTAVLINAIKEQQEIIEDLKTRITKLEN